MRYLTDIEKRFNRKSMERLEKDNIGAKYLIKFHTLQLEEGIKFNYEAKLEETKDIVRKFTEQIEMNIKQIAILKQQNDKGVPEKKNPIIK